MYYFIISDILSPLLASGEWCPLWHWGFAGRLEKHSGLSWFPPLPAEGSRLPGASYRQRCPGPWPIHPRRTLLLPQTRISREKKSPGDWLRSQGGQAGSSSHPPTLGKYRRVPPVGDQQVAPQHRSRRRAGPVPARRRLRGPGRSQRRGGARVGRRLLPAPGRPGVTGGNNKDSWQPLPAPEREHESMAAGHRRVVPRQRERKFPPASLFPIFFFFLR